MLVQPADGLGVVDVTQIREQLLQIDGFGSREAVALSIAIEPRADVGSHALSAVEALVELDRGADLCWNTALSLGKPVPAPSVRMRLSIAVKMSVSCAGATVKLSPVAGVPVTVMRTPRNWIVLPEVNPVPGASAPASAWCRPRRPSRVGLVNCSV